MTEYFLISESTTGAHLVESVENDEKITTYSMNIPLNVKFDESEKKYINNTNILRMSEFKELLADYKIAKSNNHEVYFLIGFDGDGQGEYMASVLREALLECDIPNDKIFRTPFVEDEYFTGCVFKYIDDFLHFNGLNQEFMNYLKIKKMKVLTINQALAINKLATTAKNNKEFIVVNNSGTSTFTFITNYLNSKKQETQNG